MMKPTKLLCSTAACLLLLLVPVFASLPAQERMDEDATSSSEHSAEAMSPDLQDEAARQTAEKRREIIEDAVEALRESENALSALYDGRTDDALQALENAVGKLELVLARERGLALAPVEVDLLVFDLYATTEKVREAVERADELLEDGMVQEARSLMSDLASEIVISVTNLPLATYPEAIKAVTPLIDAGKTDEAKRALEVALSTLVIVDTIIPLPVLRTNILLEDAEKLAEKDARSEDENMRLSKHLEAARMQLELGEALGYGSEELFEEFYMELEEIETKTAGGKSGDGFFDNLKEALSKAFG
jgi:hypothetical protein